MVHAQMDKVGNPEVFEYVTLIQRMHVSCLRLITSPKTAEGRKDATEAMFYEGEGTGGK